MREDLSIRLLLHRERTRSIREYVIRVLKRRQAKRDEFWPLREVSFAVDSGERLGIIGPNGAGKSTRLKVIAGIIPPSVGMSARLGFAIATDVEPDLLLLDEVFSVGDAAFQQKCEARMEGFKAKGVTILLVSHDLDLIRKTCSRTLFLHHGRTVAIGPTDEVVAEYQRFSSS
jgi:ABC-type polysaccharide/polyol phosphate transport system ATPase subunit